MDLSAIYRPVSNQSEHCSEIYEDDQGNPPSKTLFIGDLPDNIKGIELGKFFEKFGTVTATTPASFATTPRGYGFVTFADVNSAKKALFECHGARLFRQYMSNAIRFSTSNQQARMEQASESSKVNAARSQWLGPISKESKSSIGKENDAERSNLPLSGHASSPPNAPKAPRAMLARVQESMDTPKSVSRDISPPPLRRSDSYVRSNRPVSDCYRPGERDDSRPIQTTYGGREVDRYVPGQQFEDTANSPPRRGEDRRPLSTQTSSSKLFRNLSWKALDTNREVATETPSGHTLISFKSDNKSKHKADVQETLTLQKRTSDAPAINSSPGADDSSALNADRATQAPAVRDVSLSVEGTLDQPAILDKSLYLSQVPRQNSKLLRAKSQSSNTSPSSPHSATVLGPPKLTIQRLRVHTGPRLHNDETASTVSHATTSCTKATTSSTASKREALCMQCGKEEDAIIGKFTQCQTCTRRYHPGCGRPSPESATDGIPFSCGSCQKKEKGAKTPLKQNRAPSPDPSTPTDLISAARISANTIETAMLTDDTLVSTPENNTQQRQSLGDLDGASDPHVRPAQVRVTPPGALENPTPLENDLQEAHTTSIALPPTASKETVPDVPFVKSAIEVNIEGANEHSRLFPTKSPFTAIDAVGQALGSPDNDHHHHSMQMKQHDVDMLRVRSPVTQPTLLDRRRPSDPRPRASSLSEVQLKAAATAARYKAVTCPFWRIHGCDRTTEECMFAHHSTVIDAPSGGRINRNWTCYFWRKPFLCLDGPSCPFSHEDTGLYLTEDRRASTKHITCTFWYRHHCTKPADVCKYAHQDTGIYLNRQRTHNPMRPPLREQYRYSLEYDHDPRYTQTAETDARNTRRDPAYSSRVADNIPREQSQNLKISRPSLAEDTQAGELQRPSTGGQPSSASQAIDSLSDPGSPYSPMSAMAEDSKVISAAEVGASLSPVLSTPRRIADPVHGVETPFSPTTSVSSSIRDVHPDRRKQIDILDYPGEDDPPLDRPAYNTSRAALNLSNEPNTTPSKVAVEPTNPVSALERMIRTSQPSVPQDLNPALEADTGNVNEPKKEATLQATPARHFAKRSTVDPRIRRRMAEASAQEKTAPPSDVSNDKMPTLKKCEKCEKRIMGSSTLCTSCTSDLLPRGDAIAKLHELAELSAPSLTEKHELDTEIEDIASSVAVFMVKKAARSVLAVGKNSGATSTASPDLNNNFKRPNEGSPFISRKRLKVDVPITMKRVPSQLLKTHPALQYRDPKSTKALEELNRLDREKTERATAARSPEKSGVLSENTVEEVGDKENKRPSFSPVSKLGEGHTPDLSPMEVDNTKSVNKSKSLDKTEPTRADEVVDAPVLHSDPVVRAEKRRNSDITKSDDPATVLSKPRSMRRSGKNVKQPSVSRHCHQCADSHKKCLHSQNGQLDPAKCYEYLREIQSFPKKQGSFTYRAQLEKIEEAARRYRASSTDQDSDISDLTELPEEALTDPDENEKETAATSPASSEDLLQRFMGKPKPNAGSPAKNDVRSSGVARTVEQSTLASMPTPAHTPSPALPRPERPLREATPPAASRKRRSAAPEQNQDHSELLNALRKRGIQFDSDTDSDDEMEEIPPQQGTSSDLLGLKPKATSQDLFEVSPFLRPQASTLRNPDPPIIASTSRAAMSKKQLWKSLLQRQCAERRSKYGNPHQLLSQDMPSRTVRTTVEQELPLSAEDRANFVVPMRVDRRVDMPFEKFMRMPEEPVVVREKVVRERGKVVEFELAYREGKRDREGVVSLAGRRVRDSGERWPFARG